VNSKVANFSEKLATFGDEIMFLTILDFCLNMVLAIIGWGRVIGVENVPQEGSFIIVTNHMSKADAPMIFLTVPVATSRIFYFAADKWNEHWFFGPILRRANAVFIDREEVSRQALKESLDILENGGIFGLAPEGTRSKTATMAKGKDGAAYLAMKAKVPIVPIGLINTDVVGKRIKRLDRTEMTVVYGEPFMLPDLGRRVKGREMPAFTHYIMIHIANLVPERYHGYYANSPALAALRRGEDPLPFCYEAEGLEMPAK
jgi:1-acyl-sn-glycerol-3-phosphate acyltransferase